MVAPCQFLARERASPSISPIYFVVTWQIRSYVFVRNHPNHWVYTVDKQYLIAGSRCSCCTCLKYDAEMTIAGYDIDEVNLVQGWAAYLGS